MPSNRIFLFRRIKKLRRIESRIGPLDAKACEGLPCKEEGAAHKRLPSASGRSVAFAQRLCDGRSDLSNHLLFDLVFDNGAVKTFAVEVTDQLQEQTQGGVITLTIDCGEVEEPDPPKPVDPDDPEKPDEPLPTSGSLFIPTVEDYDDVIWEGGF